VSSRSSSQLALPLWLHGSIFLALLLLAYGDVLRTLVHEWYGRRYFAYGFLILPIFLYLVWQKKEILARLTPSSAPRGVIILLGALALGLVGRVIGDLFTIRLSMLLAFSSLVYVVLGARYLKVLVFPLTYLFLVIPPPYLLVKEIAFYLRILIAFLASHALQAAGVPTYQESYFLYLPNITLEVADDCSGIASLLAMFAVGLFYVHFLPVGLRAKVLVMIGALVFPIATNLLRVFLVGFTVYHYGPIMLGAFFHVFSGTFTFGLALLMLVALGEFLSRRGRKEKIPPAPGAVENFDGFARIASIGRPASWHFFFIIAMFAGAIYLSEQLSAQRRMGLHADLRELPGTLGNYVQSKASAAEPYQDPNAENSLSRSYYGPDDKEMELFIGYRSYQDGQNRLLSPKLVFPEKWNFVWVNSDHIAIPGSVPLNASWMLTRSGEIQRLVLYWYQARGHSFASEISHRLNQVASVFSSGRTDAAIVHIATPVNDTENLESAKERIRNFVVYVYPHLMRMLPA